MDLQTIGNIVDTNDDNDDFVEDDQTPTYSGDLGVDSSVIRTSKVTLASILLDDSASMKWAEEKVVSCVRGALEEIRGVKSRHDVLVGIKTLWHGWIVPFTRIEDVEFDSSHYSATGDRTPLYRQTLDLLNAVSAKQAELSGEGIPARSVSLIMTDGDDNQTREYYSALSAEMTTFTEKNSNSVYGVGFGDTATQTLLGINIPKECVKKANSALDLQKAFASFSRATSAAASGAQAPAGLNVQ